MRANRQKDQSLFRVKGGLVRARGEFEKGERRDDGFGSARD